MLYPFVPIQCPNIVQIIWGQLALRYFQQRAVRRGKVDDPVVVVHKCCILPMRTSGVMPHSELSGACSYRSRVSTENNANGWITRCCSFLVALESAGILVTNGEGVLGTFGVGGEC